MRARLDALAMGILAAMPYAYCFYLGLLTGHIFGGAK